MDEEIVRQAAYELFYRRVFYFEECTRFETHEAACRRAANRLIDRIKDKMNETGK